MRTALGVIFALLAWISALPAVDFGALQPKGYVSDFAGALNEGTQQELERYCARVETATGAQMALVTLITLQGEPIEDVANLLFRKWGIGKKGKDEGILLLLVIQDRRSRLEVGYGLEPIIPDGFAGSVLREMRPALRQNDYDAALSAAAHTIGSHIAQSKGVTIDETLPARQRHPRQRMDIPWPLLLGGGVLLLWLLTRAGSGPRGGWGGGGGGGLLNALLLGQMMSGRGYGWGGRGGGGFGGYDSGDSFGGFGGGDSGGGGASSNW